MTAAATAVIVGSAIGAFAFFTANGNGTGSATVGTSTSWVVTSTAVSGSLTPGGPASTIQYYVTNPSSGHQGLAQVVISVANSDGSPWTSVSGCSASDFIIGTATHGAAYTDTQLAGDFTPGQQQTASVTIQMWNNPTTSQDGCKLATVPLYLQAS